MNFHRFSVPCRVVSVLVFVINFIRVFSWYLCFKSMNELHTYILSAKLEQLFSSTWPGKLSKNKWNWLAPQNKAFRIASSGLFKFITVWRIKQNSYVELILMFISYYLQDFFYLDSCSTHTQHIQSNLNQVTTLAAFVQ